MRSTSNVDGDATPDFERRHSEPDPRDPSRLGHTSERQVDAAVAFILRSTGQRPQTEAEIDAKLSGRGYDGDIRAAALARAKTVGAIDDAAFARAWVSDRGEGRGYGVPRLRQELRDRGVPGVIAEDALDTLADRDAADIAMQLARKHLARLPDALEPEAVARRLVGFLVRRGYPPALSRSVAVSVSGLDRQWD